MVDGKVEVSKLLLWYGADFGGEDSAKLNWIHKGITRTSSVLWSDKCKCLALLEVHSLISAIKLDMNWFNDTSIL